LGSLASKGIYLGKKDLIIRKNVPLSKSSPGDQDP
jgi:hypothetical protein